MQRQVISMKFFAGMSNAEAASALGRREGAINALQHRALRRLGKILEDRGWRS
jgi:RNA polymerase sigma-70 factor (ECF subfamily)